MSVVRDIVYIVRRNDIPVSLWLWLRCRRRGVFLLNRIFDFIRRVPYRLMAVLAIFFHRLPESTKNTLRQGRLYGWIIPIRARAQSRSIRFLNKGITRDHFFRELNRRNVRYVLLRWWQGLPSYFPENEDLDLLIDDDDVVLITDLVTYQQVGHQCDIYTVRGKHGGSYHSIPYFPVAMATGLIRDRVLHEGFVYVPSAELYFASMAYHAIYHKGVGSGIEGFGLGKSEVLEHDYAALLESSAARANVELDISLGAIVGWLDKNGLGPSGDTLSKLSEIKPELLCLSTALSRDTRGGELVVYVVRERTLKHDLLDEFISLLKSNGLEIVKVVVLTEEQKKYCAKNIRGGDWDRGPYAFSGGEPACIVAAFDYSPKPLSDKRIRQYPRVTNARTVDLKYKFRDRLAEEKLIVGNYNGVHSADNEHEAYEYLALIGHVDGVKKRANIIRDSFSTRFPVLKKLSENTRSKVELIEYQGTIAVKKTFRLGCERFLNREIYATAKLALKYDFIPPLLEKGDNYIVIPFYEDVLCGSSNADKRSLLRERKSDIYKVIDSMFAEGLSYINFTCGNVLLTSEGKFIAIDFEFLQTYQHKPISLDCAYEVVGVPRDYAGDLPIGFGYGNSSFWSVWKPWIGSWKACKASRPNVSG